MKFARFALIACIPAVVAATNTATASSKAADAESILRMTGCYHVSFDSKETSVTDPSYPTRSKDYYSEGTEWIVATEVSENRIELQHVLIGTGAPLKHWNQIWQYEPETYWAFKGDSTWEKTAAGESQGKWAQYVGQVDDSPRYECVAPWQYAKDGELWQCQTWAPLPRREFSQRSDYNVMDRNNRHRFTSDGWVHEQANGKLLVKGATVTEIARELTINTYKRIDDKQCQQAQKFWVIHGPAWSPIKRVWHDLMASQQVLRLAPKVEGAMLWERLFALADSAIGGKLSPAEIETRARAEIERFRR